MAKITLTIQGDNKHALDSIKVIKERLSEIEKHPINIGVKASGLDAVAAKLNEISEAETKATEAAAKLANAEARKINAQTKAAQAATKLGQAQKEQTQAQDSASESSKRAAITAEQLAQGFLNGAKNAERAVSEGKQLYKLYLELTKSATAAAQAQDNVAQSTALVIRNMGQLAVQMRSLSAYYGQAGGGSTSTGGGGFLSGAAQRLLGEGENWRYYDPSREYVYTTDYTVTDAEAASVLNGSAQSIDDIAGAATRGAQAFGSFSDGIKSAWTQLKEGTPIADALGDSVENIIVKITTWQVVNGIVAGIKRSFKEALETLKEVDSELVTIRKVTGFNDEQIAGIREQAFSTASAYGVGAADYLESVAQFSRAGYKEQASALAELSTKTQIVGDTTAEVANQFLLSVDAAYKYKGSITELTKVLDGANEIDNKYATSIEKIAEGLGTVAPVAAQMHVGVDELSAAIGTITAVTQRSGTEAARALRALFLNIAGDTTTEIDEGITWTTGEIAGLADVVKRYATEAYNAAQATGAVIDPMEAIGGLAQSMKEGVLTEQELLSMVSDIGGKLRSSQLLALIQNWDMYQSMLVDYGNAIGSADKEVANALDSWERKSEILKNTWTEFISHLIDSNTIKTGLDFLTGFVKVLDNGIGKTVALSAAIYSLLKIAASATTSNLFHFVITELGMIFTSASEAGVAVANLWALFSSSPMAWAVAAAALIYGVTAAIDALTVTYEEQSKKLDELRRKYDELYGTGSDYDTLVNKAEELTKEEERRLAVLEAQEESLRQQILDQQKLTFEAWRREQVGAWTPSPTQMGAGGEAVRNYVATGTGATIDLTAQEAIEARNALRDLNNEHMAGAISTTEYRAALAELTEGLEKSVKAIKDGEEAGVELTTAEQSLLAIYELITDTIVDWRETEVSVTQATSELAQSTSTLEETVEATTDALAALNSEIDATQSAINTLIAAQEEYNENGFISIDTLQTLLALDADYLDALIDENGQLNFNAEAVENLINGKNELLDKLAAEAIANYAAERAQELLAEQNNLTADAADNVASSLEDASLVALQSGESALTAAAGWEALWQSIARTGMGQGLNAHYADRLVADTRSYAANVQSLLGKVSVSSSGWTSKTSAASAKSGSSGSSGSGGSSSSGSTKDEELEYLKSIVSLREGELSLMQARGDSEDEQIDKIREIQDALHDEAEYLRSIGADQADINALSTKWWKLENDILSIQEKIKKAQDEIVDNFKDEMSDYLDTAEEAAKGPLQEQLDALKAQKDAISDAREEEELLLAVEKARVALANAQNERNVRQYNAATGQWEWVANAQTVQSAEETLLKAEQALAEFYENQAYDAMVASLEQQIDNIEAAYDELRDSVSEIADAIKDGSMTISEAFDYLLIAAATAAAKFGVSGLTEAIAGGGSSFFADSIIERMKANSAAWHSADESGQQALADENLALGTSMGWHRGEDGYWYDANGNRVYDRGGILRGRGAIKATQSDEMVLPPTMTSSLLKAEASGAFNALMEHLGIVTAAANSYVGFGGGLTRSSIGEQHNGDVFYFNGIEISNVTEGTTMGEFIRRVKTLPLYSGG